MSGIYSTLLSSTNDLDASGSTAETDTELVAAVTGQTIKVAWIFYMTDTACIVTFETGTSGAKYILTPAASGGVDLLAPPGIFLFECTSGESLTYTTSVAGIHTVTVAYTQG